MSFNSTPHELINELFPVVRHCISPLVEIVRTNPNLATEVIELAVMIGINQAMARIHWDEMKDKLNKIQSTQFPQW